MADVSKLGLFDIVGVTEKELGRTMLERMLQVARLREAMDRAQIDAPLHIFGALDPLSVYLYFISGAEIFDGLTWLRYGYRDGICVYLHNYHVLAHGLEKSDEQIRTKVLSDNLYGLDRIRRSLLDFSLSKDFGKLTPHDVLAKNAYDSLQSALNGGL